MGAPQWIFLILVVLSWLATAFKHGEPKYNYNIGWESLNVIVTLGLLYWGGFFS